MTIVPPYLKKGDTIGLVCPAGYLPYQQATTCMQVLQQWGFKVKVGKTVGNQSNYFSGTDEERLTDLQQMLDDNTVQAVLCARGGYGTGRIIEALDFKKFKKKPKWIIGFSDITVLHCHLLKRYNIAGLHAPMAGAFNNDGGENEYVQSLKKALLGKKARYLCKPHAYNIPGKVTAPLVGGNLSLLVHLTGTPSAVSTKGCILFIEDIGEYVYNIDRMMYQLQRSGKLERLAALIVGKFSDMKDTVIPFGATAEDCIKAITKQYDYPVCFNFSVSHQIENYAVKTGVVYQLAITNKKVSLTEQ